MSNNYGNQRSEQRVIIDRKYKFEILLKPKEKSKYRRFILKCILWNIASKGIGILIKKNERIINHLTIGKIIKVRYYDNLTDIPKPFFQADIRHVSPSQNPKYKDYVQVGMLIIKNQKQA